jgi:hypothetical protein
MVASLVSVMRRESVVVDVDTEAEDIGEYTAD